MLDSFIFIANLKNLHEHKREDFIYNEKFTEDYFESVVIVTQILLITRMLLLLLSYKFIKFARWNIYLDMMIICMLSLRP